MMRTEDSAGGEVESCGESGESEGSKSSRERLAIGELRVCDSLCAGESGEGK